MTSKANHYAIIVAGGKGLRMGQELPKQFLPIGGKPILMHTISCFADICQEILLVLPSAQVDYWQNLCQEYSFDIPHTICIGGQTRFHSVQNGLKVLHDREGLVAIHDGVRPFVSQEVIRECFFRASSTGAALPYLPMTDSLRKLNPNLPTYSQAVPRKDYLTIQTPQVFDLGKLSIAYQQEYTDDFTDDASVWEAKIGSEIALVRSNIENIKITTPIDLIVAEELVKTLP